MIIERAKPEDFRSVRQFYHSLIDAMQGTEYHPMWQKDIYPAPEDLRSALEEGCLYVGMEEGRIAAAMVVNRKYNEEYEKAAWKHAVKPEKVMVIHMLGVHSDFSRRGFGKEMVRYAIDLARQTGMMEVRLDVLKGNLPAERLYESLGFRCVDTIPMFYEDTGWTDFELYEYEV